MSKENANTRESFDFYFAWQSSIHLYKLYVKFQSH